MTGGGVIINMLSTMGFKGNVGISAYITSKHALVGTTKALALEFTPMDIRVLGVAPGFVTTRDGRPTGPAEGRRRGHRRQSRPHPRWAARRARRHRPCRAVRLHRPGGVHDRFHARRRRGSLAS